MNYLRKRFVVLTAVPVVALVGVIPAMAQTPVPPPTASELVTAGSSLMSSTGVAPVIFAGAIIGVAVYLFRRFKTGAR